MSIKKHLMMTYHGERLSFVALLHARLNGVDSAGGIMAGGARVQFAEAINLLGVTLDQTLSMDRHVANIAQSCSYHTRACNTEDWLHGWGEGYFLPLTL